MTINDGMTLIKVLVTWWSVSWLLRILVVGGLVAVIYQRWHRRKY
ncbi:hypothetical protein ACRPMQ_12275 [Lactiplantibacillus argentoratensis]